MRQNIVQLIKWIIYICSMKKICLCRLRTRGIVLTFDDGPDVGNTPKILSILKKRKIKAIFFTTGDRLLKNQKEAKLIINDGHELGNHTFEHLDLKKCNIKDYFKSISKTESIIKKLTQGHQRLKLMRTPYGRISLSLILYIINNNYILAGWTVDSRDSFIRDSFNLIAFIKSKKFKNGDILLFHEDYKHTVDALPDILDYLIGQGYSFSTFSNNGC